MTTPVLFMIYNFRAMPCVCVKGRGDVGGVLRGGWGREGGYIKRQR